MRDAILVLFADAEASGETALRSPRLGVWSDHPVSGTLLGPGSRAGTLRELDRRRALVVPDGVIGRVAEAPRRDIAIAVEYGEVLFRVVPIAGGTKSAASARPRTAGSASGTFSVAAPTDGVFYLHPAPGAPPFVAKGQRVHEGQTIGLIEVMKTFNPILYGGGSLPAEAEVVEVAAIDGHEVRAGQPLIVVR